MAAGSALQTQPLQGPATIYRGLSGVEFCEGLAANSVSAGAVLRLGTEVSDVCALDPPTSGFELALSGHGEAARLRARAVVLATGSLEPWLDVSGLPLRGSALSGDVQAGLNRAGVRPGRRVVMVGSDNAGLLIAANLLDAGVEVVAVVDESPSVVGREVNAEPLRDAGVELLTSTRLVELHGTERVEAVTVDAAGARRTLRADCLCMAGPRRPDTRLAAGLGLPMLQLPVMGGETPAHDARLAAAIAGVYVCGDAAGVENGAVSLESGRLARSRGDGLPGQPASRFRAADQAGARTAGIPAARSQRARPPRGEGGAGAGSAKFSVGHPHPNALPQGREDCFTPIPVSSTGQALTFTRRGEGTVPPCARGRV